MATRSKASNRAEETLRQGAADNPEVLLVLEIAKRAQAAALTDPVRHIGIATEIVALPTNSQCPV